MFVAHWAAPVESYLTINISKSNIFVNEPYVPILLNPGKFEPVDILGGLKTYNKMKVNDKIKNDYCEDNYLNLIRIRYDQSDDIYQILWDSLKIYIKKPN